MRLGGAAGTPRRSANVGASSFGATSLIGRPSLVVGGTARSRAAARGWRRSAGRRRRQREDDGGPRAEFGFDPQIAAMLARKRGCDGKAETGAFVRAQM